MSSSFLTALALAKPGDAVGVPSGVYRAKIVTAQVKPGNTVARILRLDLEIVDEGAFIGRKMIKNQPLTDKGAPYVAALLDHCNLLDIASNAAQGVAFENGDDSIMRLFVGKVITVKRTVKTDSDEIAMDIVGR